jgi:enoyl-CoA hydratase
VSAEPRDSFVRLERQDSVGLIRLDHPPVNVLDRAVLDSLSRRLQEARTDSRIRAVVLASAVEGVFAAGADIREMAPLDPAGARRHGGRGQSITRQVERLPIPVVAAVNGTCLGGGCEIVQACDFVIASENATFGQPEIRLGIMPGWGGTRRLPRRIGAVRARRWILLGRPVSASEAHSAGLVDSVVTPSELLSAARGLAGELARFSSEALAAAKSAINRALDPTVDEGLRYELSLWAKLFGTADQREGMAAFLEKREPRVEERLIGVPATAARRGAKPRRRSFRDRTESQPTRRKNRSDSSRAAPRWLSR